MIVHPYTACWDGRPRFDPSPARRAIRQAAPMAHYLRQLENRMHHECFPADDELFKLVEQASAAMHRLAIHTHYQACERVKRKPN